MLLLTESHQSDEKHSKSKSHGKKDHKPKKDLFGSEETNNNDGQHEEEKKEGEKKPIIDINMNPNMNTPTNQSDADDSVINSSKDCQGPFPGYPDW